MNRYSSFGDMTPMTGGEWIRYEDHVEAMKRAWDGGQTLQRAIDRAPSADNTATELAIAASQFPAIAGMTPAGAIGWLSVELAAAREAHPAGEAQPVAHVPVHPRNGPLWMDTIPRGSEVHRSNRYPLMALYAAPPSSDAAPVAQPMTRETLYAAIHDALMNHSLMHTADADGGELPLIDGLTPPGSGSIKSGREEIARIADAIIDVLPDFDAGAQPMTDEQILAAVDACFDQGYYAVDNADWIKFARAILAQRSASGQSIGLFDIPKETANAICAGIASITGARVYWHYFGGRVHMKALAAPAPAGCEMRDLAKQGAEPVYDQSVVKRIATQMGWTPPSASPAALTEEWEAPFVIDTTHPNQAYVRLGFSSKEARKQFVKATRYGNPSIAASQADKIKE